MKKNIVALILTVMLLQNFVLATPSQSTNDFSLEIDSAVIPKGGGGGGKSRSGGGLNGGAITAISLGAIGGAALIGGLALFLKPYWAKGMTSGAASGLDSPILALCLYEKAVQNLTNKYQNEPLLIKGLHQEKIKECPNSKYILIPDTEILSNTFNTVVFKVPVEMKNTQGMIKVRMIQVSTPLNGFNIGSEMFLGTDVHSQNNTNKRLEVPFKTEKADRTNGIIIKSGQIDTAKLNADFTGFLIVSYKELATLKSATKTEKYAFVIEFSR